MRKQQWTRNARSSKRFEPGSWDKAKNKKEVILEAQKDTRRVHFDIDGQSVISNMRSYNQIFRSIKVESYSEVTL